MINNEKNYRKLYKVDRQGGQSLYFGSGPIRPTYQKKYVQNVKELRSITVVELNRTGSREGKKDFFLQGRTLKTFERKEKETVFELVERANKKLIPFTWLKKKFSNKGIQHFDF